MSCYGQRLHSRSFLWFFFFSHSTQVLHASSHPARSCSLYPSCLLLGSFCRLALRNCVQVTALFSFAVFYTDQPGVYTGAVYVEKLAQPMSPTHRRGGRWVMWMMLCSNLHPVRVDVICFSMLDRSSPLFDWHGLWMHSLLRVIDIWLEGGISPLLSLHEMLKDYVKWALLAGSVAYIWVSESFW